MEIDDRYTWSSRFLVTQPVLVLVTITETQKNQFLLVLVVAMTFLLMNWIVIKDTLRILKSSDPIHNLLKEYFWVLTYGLLNIPMFASLYYSFGLNQSGTVVTGDWTASIYFSIVTWTTLGYGDLLPVPELRIVAAFQALMGYMYMAIFMGILLNLSQHIKKN